MIKPTLQEIIERLQSVLDGKVSREEVSTWAENWVRLFSDESGLSDTDLLTWRYLDVVSGIDLKDSPTEYLHVEADILAWIERFEEKK